MNTAGSAAYGAHGSNVQGTGSAAGNGQLRDPAAHGDGEFAGSVAPAVAAAPALLGGREVGLDDGGLARAGRADEHDGVALTVATLSRAIRSLGGPWAATPKPLLRLLQWWDERWAAAGLPVLFAGVTVAEIQGRLQRMRDHPEEMAPVEEGEEEDEGEKEEEEGEKEEEEEEEEEEEGEKEEEEEEEGGGVPPARRAAFRPTRLWNGTMDDGLMWAIGKRGGLFLSGADGRLFATGTPILSLLQGPWDDREVEAGRPRRFAGLTVPQVQHRLYRLRKAVMASPGARRSVCTVAFVECIARGLPPSQIWAIAGFPPDVFEEMTARRTACRHAVAEAHRRGITLETMKVLRTN